MRIIYITRKFPPSIGGSENFSYNLSKQLSALAETHIIAWSSPRSSLPLFFLSAFVQCLQKIYVWRRANPEGTIIVHCGDGLLAPLAVSIERAAKVPVSLTVHGYDITYTNRLYQAILGRTLWRVSRIACDSDFTFNLCIRTGVTQDKLYHIPLGVDAELYYPLSRAEAATQISAYVSSDFEQRKILLTVGRLVPRKGVYWFIQFVLPHLSEIDPSVVYWVIGEGQDYGRLQELITRLSLEDHVILFGAVPLDILRAAASLAHLFVAPNIKIEGNPEGFGLVTIEARAMGLPVIASNVDGLGQSITEGVDGILLPDRDHVAFVHTIIEYLNNKQMLSSAEEIRRRMIEQYSWHQVARLYMEMFAHGLISHESNS